MTEKLNNVVFRIDNRLVHGQIAVNWKQALEFDAIVIPDDQLKADHLNETIMKLAVQSANLEGHFVSVAEAPTLIQRLQRQHQYHLLSNRPFNIFVVCRTPAVVRQLIAQQVPTQQVTIWNMFDRPGKHKVAGTVYMDEQDLADVQAIKHQGIEVAIQETPYSKTFAIPTSFKE